MKKPFTKYLVLCLAPEAQLHNGGTYKGSELETNSFKAADKHFKMICSKAHRGDTVQFWTYEDGDNSPELMDEFLVTEDKCIFELN